jgi:hypothetical protein
MRIELAIEHDKPLPHSLGRMLDVCPEAFFGIEVWRAVPHSPLYEVSSEGRIRRVAGVIETTCGHQFSVRGGLLRPQLSNHGYQYVTLSEGGKSRRVSVHSLVLEAFMGEKPGADYVVAHGNDIRSDNRLFNLRWATYAENTGDMLRRRRNCRGESSPLSKLTEGDVLEIRSSKDAAKALAMHLGVTPKTIRSVRRRSAWRHVE